MFTVNRDSPWKFKKRKTTRQTFEPMPRNSSPGQENATFTVNVNVDEDVAVREALSDNEILDNTLTTSTQSWLFTASITLEKSVDNAGPSLIQRKKITIFFCWKILIVFSIAVSVCCFHIHTNRLIYIYLYGLILRTVLLIIITFFITLGDSNISVRPLEPLKQFQHSVIRSFSHVPPPSRRNCRESNFTGEKSRDRFFLIQRILDATWRKLHAHADFLVVLFSFIAFPRRGRTDEKNKSSSDTPCGGGCARARTADDITRAWRFQLSVSTDRVPTNICSQAVSARDSVICISRTRFSFFGFFFCHFVCRRVGRIKYIRASPIRNPNRTELNSRVLTTLGGRWKYVTRAFRSYGIFSLPVFRAR